MWSDSANVPVSPILDVSVEELMPRARLLGPHEEMAISDLDEDDSAAFLAAIKN